MKKKRNNDMAKCLPLTAHLLVVGSFSTPTSPFAAVSRVEREPDFFPRTPPSMEPSCAQTRGWGMPRVRSRATHLTPDPYPNFSPRAAAPPLRAVRSSPD